MENFTAQIIGVFLAETVKNVAKGSANTLYNNSNLLFYSEIMTLGLNDSLNAEEITRQLEAKPEVLETVRQKLNDHPKLAEEMAKIVNEQSGNTRQVTANNYVENTESLTINQSGGQYANEIKNIIQNLQPELPKPSLKAEISFNQNPSYGNLEELYGWRIKLINDGEITVKNFRVDIKFPNIFLNQHTGYAIEVVEKRTQDYRLFRMTSEHHRNKVLHSDDEYSVFEGSYSVSKVLRENGDLERLVFINIYADDILVDKIERKMSEFVSNE